MKRKRVLIAAAVVVAVLLFIYLGFSLYFIKHFCFGTTLNGVDISCETVQTIMENWQDEVDAYSIDIIERDGTVNEISGRDIDLKLRWDDTVDNFLAQQNGFAWVIKIFANDDFTTDKLAACNKELLKDVLNSTHFMSAEMQVMPQNATASSYDSNDGFTVVEAVDGTAIDIDTIYDLVEAAVNCLKTEYVIADEGGYIQPEILGDDEQLADSIKLMNEYAKSSITFAVGDDRTVLDADEFGDWIVLGEDLSVSISSDAISEYVDGLGKKYNTFGKTETLDTTYGTTVEITNNHYGWKIDKEAEKAQIEAELMSGEATERDLNYTYTANSHTGHDYGNSYVEINLTAQHLFVYKDGVMVTESDFVSGNAAKGNGTPTGVFGLTYKTTNATLRGEDYETPVSFWMPFNGNVGMHDATWRSKFGGSIYKSNGSHGCVNLPYSAAKTIYSYLSTNYPVLVYELPGTESGTTQSTTTQNTQTQNTTTQDTTTQDTTTQDTTTQNTDT